MGVPAFYRWLVEKYPKIMVNATEEEERGEGNPNPNRLEFDNFYLDMNGIIHPCFHPEDTLSSPSTFDEVFASIFQYIDQLFRIVRPRKLLYMAIDGVAPRAKMNQQRSRRFQTAKNAEIAEIEEEKLRKEFEIKGKRVEPKLQCEVLDSNVITPGTEFMDKLSKALKYYIHLRLNSDPGWKNIKVILSDANVPGEGEHKIMSFIRLQRNLEGYDPNTRHCLYGLDADLIMLALATHEIHFSILREDVLKQEQQPESIMSLKNSFQNMDVNTVKSRGWFGEVLKTKGKPKKPYQFLNIWTLREYLKLHLEINEPAFEINFERIVDDFIFMCFLIGNDFLPHMPTLEIHEGGIDLVMTVYKEEFNSMGGYLIDTSRLKERNAGYMKKKRVERLITSVGNYEEKIFHKRSEIRERKLRRILRENSDKKEELDNEQEKMFNQTNACYRVFDAGSGYSGTPNDEFSILRRVDQETIVAENIEYFNYEDTDVSKNTKELRQQLKILLREKSDIFKHGNLPRDKVRLGHPGWRERYYKEKFFAENADQIEKIRKEIIQNYAEGLCWVLRYYYEGVCSWTWYYKYHYGPFASDFKGFSRTDIKFQKGAPFKPFAQLMSVLPPRSSHALPESYRQLMTSEDSKIRYFYPTDFEVDTDGKRYLWQGVTKLPFIEEKCLLTEIEKLKNELTDDEVRRNSVSDNRIFTRKSHEFGSQILSIYDHHKHASERGLSQVKVPIEFGNSGGPNGFLYSDDYPNICHLISPVKSMEDLTENSVIFAVFENPTLHDHIPELPRNVTMPDEEITEADIEETPLWHTYSGSPPHVVNGSQCRQRYVKAGNMVGTSSNSLTERQICNGAGSGWGSGRGNGCKEVLNSSRNSKTWAGIQAPNGSIGDSQSVTFSNSNYNNYGSVSGSDWKYNHYGSGASYSNRNNNNYCSGASYSNRNNNNYGSVASYGQGRGNGWSGLANVSQNSVAGAHFQHPNSAFGQPRSGLMANKNDNWPRGALRPVTSFGRGLGRGHSEASSSNLRWTPKPKQVAPASESRFS